MRGRPDDGTPNPDAELREELQGMEARVRKMRNTRNSFSEQARTVADLSLIHISEPTRPY